MTQLFAPGYDPANLEANAAAAKTAAQSGLAVLQSSVHGNSALKSLLDAVAAYQASGSSGIPKVIADLASVKAQTDKLGNATYGLSKIETYVDDIPAILAAVNLIKGYTDGIEAKTNLLTNATYGLSKIETYVDDIPAILAAVNLIKGYTDGIEAKTNLLTSMNTVLNAVNTNTSSGTGMSLAVDRNGSTAAFTLPPGYYLVESMYARLSPVIISPAAKDASLTLHNGNWVTRVSRGGVAGYSQHDGIYGVYRIG